MKKLLFILPLIFCFSLSFARVAMVCDYDDQGNRGDCTCYENNVEVLCKCQYKDSCSSLTSSEQCFPCYQYDGGGCYDSFASACSSHGFDRNGSIQGHCFKVRYENGKAVENIIGGLVTFSYLVLIQILRLTHILVFRPLIPVQAVAIIHQMIPHKLIKKRFVQAVNANVIT